MDKQFLNIADTANLLHMFQYIAFCKNIHTLYDIWLLIHVVMFLPV